MVNQTVTGGPGTITGWDNPQERLAFYRRMLPTAQKWSAQTGIPVAVYLAINAHESNFGKSDALFGIKGAGSRGSQNLATWEAGPNGERININDSFRAYNSDDEAYADFHNLISQGRYAPAWQQYQQDHNAIGLLNNIVAAGYATDKSWGSKIANVANRFQQEMVANGIDPGAPAAQNVSASVARAPAVSVNRTPVQGQITQGFGNPFPMESGATYQGQQYAHFNRGVDYGAAGGSPVTPTVGGTVILASDDGAGWGPRVVIRDAEGFDHSYGHLDPNSIRHLRPGMTVQNDVQIGVVASGNVGTSTGPHLSYDISKNGEPVDPSPWLAQNVRAPGIPAGQAPSYLSGGSTAMAQTQGQGSDFFDKEIAEAQWHINWAQGRLTEIRNGKYGDPNSTENQNSISELQARIEEETARLTSAQAGLRTQQLTNPAAAGADPVQQASAVAGIRAQQNEHNRWIFDTFTGLIDKTFQNQLGVANVMTDILKANEANIQAAVASRVRKGELNSADAAAVIQAESMKQAAEAARFGQAMTLAGMINENDWKIAERQLPEGQNFVPQLGPDDPLAQVLGRLNIQFPGIAVRQTDFSQLDMRKSLADAQGLTPPVGDFSIDALRQVAAENKNLPVYNPTLLSASSVNLPGVPNLASENILARIPGASQAGGIDDEDLINRILQRGPYAPQPSVASGASGGSAAPVSANPTNAPLGASATGFIEAEAAAHPTVDNRPSVAQTDRLLNPGQALTRQRPDPIARVINPGQALLGQTAGGETVQRNAGTAAQDEAGGEDDGDLAALLKRLGYGVARAPVIGGAVTTARKVRSWLR